MKYIEELKKKKKKQQHLFRNITKKCKNSFISNNLVKHKYAV